MKYAPTPEQEAIFDFVEFGSGNAVVNAVAGAGKTTTLLKAFDRLPKTSVSYFVAFNKDIVKELTERAPRHVTVCTLHSLGFEAIRKVRRVKLNKFKMHEVVDSLCIAWFAEDNLPESEWSDYKARVRKLADLYRFSLASGEEELTVLAEKHDVELYNGECRRAIQVVQTMNKVKGQIDFTDMIYLPASDPNIKMPYTDFIFIDESQDLNAAQQAMLWKMLTPTTRFIAVGDPRQSIYGFAGADTDSFDKLRSFPNTVELPLSTTWRCAKKIVTFAQGIVPQIQASPNAPDGVVNEDDSFKAIKDGDMVLCRNTAPLVKMCLQFIRDGKKAWVKGGDINKTLISLITRSKTNDLSLLQDFLSDSLTRMHEMLCKKYPQVDPEDVKDMNQFVMLSEKIEVIMVIIENASIKNCADLKARLESIFSDKTEGVCFSTIHRSKGLESERVFIIERDLMPSKHAKKAWQLLQEENLKYVAYTRAKTYLGFVTDWEYKTKGKKAQKQAA